ncbi:unnamed protein product [Miscanthus lutarioriparius]|uniref:NmrA-like domain-containing protein n=1 Tax=Miscanthus lutarioriparius TaxID=422564 RepID=A0A811NWR0_9POAL|nr:unnamed protein product [Miscanthus lutarioriparius]
MVSSAYCRDTIPPTLKFSEHFCKNVTFWSYPFNDAAGFPYTYVWTGYFFGYGLPGIGQVLAQAPPDDKAVILSDGDTEVSFVDEGDIGTCTVLAVDDPRAENRTLYVKPLANTLSHNELLALWEKKTGKTFERVYLTEDAILKQIQELPVPLDILLSIVHAVYIKGEHKFKIDPSSGVDAGELYPDVKYTTVDITSTGCSELDPQGLHRVRTNYQLERDDILKPNLVTFCFANANKILTVTTRNQEEDGLGLRGHRVYTKLHSFAYSNFR